MAIEDPRNVSDDDIISPVPNTRAPPSRHKAEQAAEFLASHGDSTSITPEEEMAVLRKIDRHVLPLILGAYFFQQLDKSSLSYVSIFGLTQDTHLVGSQYSWLGSILYIAQLAMQPFAAFILVRLPNGKVVAAAIFLWGSSLAIMASCTTFASLLTMRFILGSFEALIAPSCIAITQMWWRRSEQTLRTSYWNAMNGVTYIVGSLMTYGLAHIVSRRIYRYQVIFLFCGLLTVVYSFVVLLWLPDSPMRGRMLSQREKVVAVERVRANQMGISSGKWRWEHVWETIRDGKTWCWFVVMLAISIASGGISTFGNLIVKSFGYTSFDTVLFNLPFGAIQTVAILGSGALASKIQRKGLVIAGVSILPAVGTILMLTVPREEKAVLLFGYYLVSFLAAITPLVYTWQAQNTAGDTKKKSTSAVVFIGMCAGNVIGPQLYSTDQAPLYRTGLISNLIMFALVGVLSALIPFYLMFLNKRHAKRREELGKSANIVDESMLAKKEVRTGKPVEEHVENAAQDRRPKLEEDNALHDMTDLQNEDFIYVY